MKRSAKFQRAGVLAIDPKAWGLDFFYFDEPTPREPFTIEGETAIVTIDGPLTHHADWWCDSYDAIQERVDAALASPATNLLLAIHSPGGDMAGCVELSKRIRESAASAGKKVSAFIDEKALSAGYALACAASEIAITETAFVGSIGCIGSLEDHTGYDKMLGMKYTLVTSGARKADGNPHQPTSEGAVDALQRDVSSLAEFFIAHVAATRGLTPDAVRALNAGVMHGSAALAAKLADSITTKSELLKILSSGTPTGPSGQDTETPMPEWQKALKKAADEGDEDAKKALAALDKKDEPAAEGGESDADKDDKAEATEGDDNKKDPPKETDEEKKAKAQARAGSVIDAAVEAAVAERMLPIEINAAISAVEKRIGALPEPTAKRARAAASLAAAKDVLATYEEATGRATAKRPATSTQGKPEAEDKPGLKGEELEAMNAAMGVNAHVVKMPKVEADGSLVLHIVKPTDLRNHLANSASARTGK